MKEYKDACYSCLMPFRKDTGVRENPQYCSFCFSGGKLVYQGSDRKEFQRMCYESMRVRGINPLLAWLYTWMIRFAPRWQAVSNMKI
jgi:hypothetical protein